ncbi:MAG: PilT/PilU family type 4a pilus ATPase [Vicinamibacterales bacterium]
MSTRVLVVDDEPAVRHVATKWLERAGYACREAASAAEAVQVLQLGTADVALVDLRMPDEDGLVLARALRRHHPHTAIVMMTGVADFGSVRDAMRAGASDYLVKPVDAPTLVAAVERATTPGAVLAAADNTEPESPTERATTTALLPSAARQATDRTSTPAMDRLFHAMCAMGASDLHLSASVPPMVRKDGEMLPLDAAAAPLATAEIAQLLEPIVPGKNRKEFEERHDSDFAYEIEGLARFRGNIFMDRKGMGAVFRIIPTKILTTENLGLSPHIVQLCQLRKGLVLVTGPTGSGKSTTLAALIDYVNRMRADHIITIEDPIEFVHPNQKCLINQREVHSHTRSFKDALRAALREDPDVLLIGEMRDLETIAIAIETAETGHLVFGTLHTTTAASTVDRVIDQFPADRQSQIRVMLAESLRGVIAQTLCRKTGGGRVAALEVLLVNPAISNLIREGKTFQIPSMMQVGKAAGMVTLNEALADLVKKGLVAAEEAHSKAVDKAGFEAMLKRGGDGGVTRAVPPRTM